LYVTGLYLIVRSSGIQIEPGNMKPQFVNPLIHATQKAFESLLQLEITFDEPSVVASMPEEFDVSGIIGLSGGIIGLFTMSFPTETAEKIISAFAGSTICIGDREDFVDAVGELANIIMRSGITEFGCGNITISSPSVVLGDHHCIQTPSDNTIIVVPCHTSAGDFSIELSIRSINSPSTPTRLTPVVAAAER